MSDITIYTTELCGFCRRAKALLDEKGAAYTEIDVTYDPGKRNEMMQRAAGRRTVPQIFIAGTHVGGCDDLYALDAKGGLDPLLARA
jgi:glutaredoxin 3